MSHIEVKHGCKHTCIVSSEEAHLTVILLRDWWIGHRPLTYSEQDHLNNPTVNVADSATYALAEQAARLVRLGL